MNVRFANRAQTLNQAAEQIQRLLQTLQLDAKLLSEADGSLTAELAFAEGSAALQRAMRAAEDVANEVDRASGVMQGRNVAGSGESPADGLHPPQQRGGTEQ